MDLDTAQDNPESTESVTPESQAQDTGHEAAFDAFSDAYDEIEGKGEEAPGEAEAAPAEETDNKPESEDQSPAVAATDKDPTEMNVEELKAWIEANPNNAKSYAHIQSAFTRASQEASALKKELEQYGGLESIKPMIEEYQWLHQTLAQNPDKLRAVQAILGTAQEQSVPEGLNDDPLYQHLSPEMQQIKQELAQAKQFIQSQQQEKQAQQVEQMVDQSLNKAFERYKAHFGSEPGREEKTQIIKAMQERGVYDHTDTLVDNLFMDKITEAKVQAALKAQTSKARRNPSMKTVNSSAATEGPALGQMDPEDAFNLAWESGGAEGYL